MKQQSMTCTYSFLGVVSCVPNKEQQRSILEWVLLLGWPGNQFGRQSDPIFSEVGEEMCPKRRKNRTTTTGFPLRLTFYWKYDGSHIHRSCICGNGYQWIRGPYTPLQTSRSERRHLPRGSECLLKAKNNNNKQTHTTSEFWLELQVVSFFKRHHDGQGNSQRLTPHPYTHIVKPFLKIIIHRVLNISICFPFNVWSSNWLHSSKTFLAFTGSTGYTPSSSQDFICLL